MPDLSEILYYTGDFSLGFVVWPLFSGICIAVLISLFVKVKLGVLVRKLLENKAETPESALSLSDLGLQKNFFVRNAMRSTSTYKQHIHAITEDSLTYHDNEYFDSDIQIVNFPDRKPKLNIDTAKYYIPKEKQFRASSTFSKESSTIISAIIAIFLLVIVASLSMVIIPFLTRMLDDFIKSIKS